MLIEIGTSQDGVPTQALARICRYATERSAGPQLADIDNPPLLNPPLGGVSKGQKQGKAESAFGCAPRGGGNGNDDIDSVMCRKGTFRGTVFFVVEGHGEVVISGGETQGFNGLQEEGGGSSTESLLAAAAFGNRRAPKNRRKHRRLRDTRVGGSSSCGGGGGSGGGAGGGGGDGGGSSTERQEATCGFQEDDTSIGESSALTWTGIVKGEETRPAAAVAGVEPEQETAATAIDAEAAASTGGCPQEFVPNAPPGREQIPGESTPIPSAAALSISFAKGQERADGDSGGSGEGWWPRSAVSAGYLRRGDFFGMEPPESPTTAGEQARELFYKRRGKAACPLL